MRSICHEFGFDLNEFVTASSGIRRYAALVVRTARFLATLTRCRVLFVQNPSIVLAFLASIYCRFGRSRKLVVDAHNVAIEQLTAENVLLRGLARQVLKAADLTVVTNGSLARQVVEFGGRPIVLPDPLPLTPALRPPAPVSETMRVVVIATYANDEPIAEILGAASALVGRCSFQFTGSAGRWLGRNPTVIPENVQFMGFVSEEDYWGLLNDANVVVDLTTRDACLVCGAYETLAVGRPIVLTDSDANRVLFGGIGTFTGMAAEEIACAIEAAASNYERIVANREAIQHSFREAWHRRATEFRASLEALRKL